MSQLNDAVFANTDTWPFRHPAINLAVPSAAEGAEGPTFRNRCALALPKYLFAEPEARLTN